MFKLTTTRLQLVACPLTVVEAAKVNPSEVERLLVVRVPNGWPTPDLQDILPFYAHKLAADPLLLGWGAWLMIQRAQRTVIGDLGFKGKPDSDGTIEMGYGVLPAFQGRGYATEATQALVAWAFSQPRVQRIVAECLADNIASIRVLEKLGMRRYGPEGRVLRWELWKEATG